MVFKRKNNARVSAAILDKDDVASSRNGDESKDKAKPILKNVSRKCTLNRIIVFLVIFNALLLLANNKASSNSTGSNLRQIDGGAADTSKEVNKAAEPAKTVENVKPVSFTGGTILNAKSIDDILNSGKTNVALNNAASQSETHSARYPAYHVVDGNRLKDYSHTKGCDPWLQVDLGSAHDVKDVVIFNRLDMFQARLKDFDVGVLQQVYGNWNVIAQIHHEGVVTEKVGFHFEPSAKGQIVHIHMDGCTEERNIHLLQVEVYGDAI